MLDMRPLASHTSLLVAISAAPGGEMIIACKSNGSLLFVRLQSWPDADGNRKTL